jgi:hypothetical protein
MRYKHIINYKYKMGGYLICDKCGGYYELQRGEKPGDFDLKLMSTFILFFFFKIGKKIIIFNPKFSRS